MSHADPLQVGLIGAGDISRYHLAAWQGLSGADVVAICDLDEGRASDRARQFGVDHVYTDAETMLGSERLDAVDIATWRATHVGLTMLAAAQGVHVLCQKPLAPTYDEAAALVEAVGGRIRVMVNENRRFAPPYRLIKQWIDEGRLGRISQCIWAGYRSSLIPNADGIRPAVARASHYATEERLMVAGALTHQIDVLRYLLGPMAMVAARTLRTEKDLPGETVATLMLETSDGAAAILAGSAVAPGFGDTPSAGPATATLSGDRLELIGSLATVTLDGEDLEARGSFSERRHFEHATAYQACFDGAVAEFVRGLRSGTPFETSAEDNLETLRLVEDAYASAARHTGAGAR